MKYDFNYLVENGCTKEMEDHLSMLADYQGRKYGRTKWDLDTEKQELNGEIDLIPDYRIL